ncbi:MAG: PQQ-binding-like beta-propeller repeat protein [Lentisphaeria bacterium]|nr:PQQ-binding-like beta-propeller repeat protein [Lentisphaeria bacterium]
MVRSVLLPLSICLLGLAAAVSAQGLPTSAQRLLAEAGTRGGIVVHVGAGEAGLWAGLTMDLRQSPNLIVHGLATDPSIVPAARRHIAEKGLYGPVSVDTLAGARLPYADNLVNLVVVSGRCGAADPGPEPGLPPGEWMRVLAPGGTLLTRFPGDRRTASGLEGWHRARKPVPRDIDEWSHFLHDAGNNAVAHDSAVAPPRSLQWVGPPLWLRSHETPSGFEAMVTGGGRLFYILDEGLIGITDQRLPERWALVCRDAFNGVLLWRRPLERWGWPEWARNRFEGKDWTEIIGARTVVPDENQRRIVVEGDRLFATLTYMGPLSILDAATGNTLATVQESAPVRQILVSEGIALVLSQGPAEEAAQTAPPPLLMAVDGRTGTPLWRKPTPSIRGLLLAVAEGRVLRQSGTSLAALDLRTGRELWETDLQARNVRTLVVADGVAVVLAAKAIEAHDAGTGAMLWHKTVPLAGGLGSEDLFVVDGVVWPAMMSVDEQGQPKGKSPHTLALGYDLRSGEERKRVFVPNLRSPEHHHRCYRNKATVRYIISALEGAEFLDLQGGNHSQDNFLRGACKLGIMPANGMLYAPPDQCFCQPGAKLLGLCALGGVRPPDPTPEPQRLEKGPAYGTVTDPPSPAAPEEQWPTFRHDAARHGATSAVVSATLEEAWRVRPGRRLTAPVAVGERVYVADADAHTLFALDLAGGQTLWRYTAGGRIDSPPTVHGGLVLLGSADGRVTCLRESDGACVWRFLAAPADTRIGAFDQIESVWPVHGSVLVRDGTAYVAAGRSTYLDGGIRLYALDPLSGQVRAQTCLDGPFPDRETWRDVSFYIRGANSDVLLSEGEWIYMRQRRLTPALEESMPEVLSSKGEMDVGLHLFSTAGLLDGSWYNRTFWMYSRRWPGFQLANQAPKSGQLLVVDENTTFGLRVFYRRNVHSLMFFPGKEGYLLFADRNDNEPQIVGEEGAREPVEWLPQSHYYRREGYRLLNTPAFGTDKGIGYTRAQPPLWKTWLPVRVRAMVKAADLLFLAGPPDLFDAADPYAPFEGRRGARLLTVSATDGTVIGELSLEAPPVFDGMIAVPGRVLASLEDGSVICWRGTRAP